MVSIVSMAGEELLTLELKDFDVAEQLKMEVAKYLDVASCQLITSSGDAFDDAQLLEAKSDESRQRLTAVVSTEDPLLQMLDLQDVDGTLHGAPRAALRRMALMVGEKMLKAACSLLQRAADRRIYKVDCPFDVLEAPPAFAPGFCTISPHLPVIPAKTPVILVPNSTGSTVTRYVSEEPTTAAEVITLCSRSFPPEVERELLRSPKAREINAREVFATATVKQYSAQEIVIELGHEFC